MGMETMVQSRPTAGRQVVAAANALTDELLAVGRAAADAIEASRMAADLLAKGCSYEDILSGDAGALLLTAKTHADALRTASTRFRTEAAKALHAEGVAMDEIAWRLGVTRQRVSRLLQDAASGRRP